MHHGLPWFENATDAALAQAKVDDKLVFVDLWAAWCHTCLSMREYVLTADNLAGARERLVFLDTDTERSENAGMLTRLPLSLGPPSTWSTQSSRCTGAG